MKTSIKIIFSALCLFALSACGQQNPPSLQDRVTDSAPPVQTEISYTGTIQSFGVDVYQDGTHKIIMDNGATVVIQSPTINLNTYIGKKVTITGSMQKLIDNKSEVFTVTKIELSGIDTNAETTDYSNQKFGFQFKYPALWEINEEPSDITFGSNGTQWAKIEVINTELGLSVYVKSKEVEDGTPVTIGGQSSIRYILPDEIRIYTPNDSAKKVYKIIFYINNASPDSESQKTLFYNFLETFSLLTGKTTETGDKCGGTDNIACKDGYVCELDSGEDNANGICVLSDTKGANPDCPYIPKPANCVNYEAKNLNKNGCPTSYTCLDKPADAAPLPSPPADVPKPLSDTTNTDPAVKPVEAPVPDPAPTSDIKTSPDTASVAPASSGLGSVANDVATDFMKNKDKILTDKDQVIRFEVAEEQSLVAVVYSESGKNYRTLYAYAKSADGYDFTKKVQYEAGVDKDWVVTDGTDIVINTDKKIISASDTSAAPQIVLKDMRLYENGYKNFSLQYPKSWYYKSFGSIENSIWTVGFGDKSLSSISDAIITVAVLDGAGTGLAKEDGDKYSAEVNRDAGSHFVISGPLTSKDTIDKMATTVVQK
jgi:predicted small lipoprotein YifL